MAEYVSVGTRAIRLRNFRYLVEKVWEGKRLAVAGALDFAQPSTVTRYMSEQSIKPIGHTLARKIEAAARATGADWVVDGYLDVPHNDQEPIAPEPARGRIPTTLDERINALPPALRQYVMMELEICERLLPHVAPSEILRGPTPKTRRAFQEYLHRMVGQITKRTA